MGRLVRLGAVILVCLAAAGCGAGGQGQSDAAPSAAARPGAAARNLVVVTIDTLRADHVGAYGYAEARTPTVDRLAREGARFGQAFATAPITLTSHASLMTGRYPAGHGARHNGMRLDANTPTLADALSHAGFATGAFIAAFPLDRRFGLIKGFQTYGDRMPPPVNGRAVNERPGREVVDEALAWLERNRQGRFFLWVHLFEPHAPYVSHGDRAQASGAENSRGAALAERAARSNSGTSAPARYDDEIAEADAQVGRVVDALRADRSSTLVVVAGDHGEAFGEHGEIGHSLFVYDTTLRVPLVMSGAGIPRGRTVDEPVALIDVAPTALGLLGVTPFDADGIDLRPLLNGARMPARDLYAESFAPLLDFGWSQLRSIRSQGSKYIEAPKAELYDTVKDPGELVNTYEANAPRASAMQAAVRRYSGAALTAGDMNDPEARRRLQALGYASGSRSPADASRPDPKDRRELAALVANVASGELEGAVLETTLRRILAEDPLNPQANLRLGYVLLGRNRCREASPHFRSAIVAHLPSADAHLGLAACQTAEHSLNAAASTLQDAERVEPGNPVVMANLGLVLSDSGHPNQAIDPLQRALAIDPDLHQARFALAIAFARAGRRGEAGAAAEDLLRRLPREAPQRAEVERLLREVK